MTTPPAVDRGKATLMNVPQYTRSLGDEASTVLDELDLRHMPWQDLLLQHAMAMTADDRWVAADVAVVLPWLEDLQHAVFLRELIGASLLTEQVLHVSATHRLADQTFFAMQQLIGTAPALECMVSKTRRSAGEQAIEFQGGGRIKFRARGRGGPRGHSADLLVLDQAHTLPFQLAKRDMLPTIASRPNPQVWWIDNQAGGSFTDLQRQAFTPDAPQVLYLEWTDPA